VIKRYDVQDRLFHSDVAYSYAIARHYGALLRSTGHLYKDGRWIGDDSGDFHLFKVMEDPGFGTQRTFDASAYWRHYVNTPFDQPSHFTYSWRPTVGRAFDTNGDFPDVRGYDPIVDPDYGDSTLA
jgi:hypothetical protein